MTVVKSDQPDALEVQAVVASVAASCCAAAAAAAVSAALERSSA